MALGSLRRRRMLMGRTRRITPGVLLFRLFFFFQAEDGIRDVAVTGVQTCALPISRRPFRSGGAVAADALVLEPGRDFRTGVDAASAWNLDAARPEGAAVRRPRARCSAPADPRALPHRWRAPVRRSRRRASRRDEPGAG